MSKKRIIPVACMVFAAAVIALAILVERSLYLPAIPVSLTFVERAKLHEAESTFRVTNHTSRMLCVAPVEVEMRHGTNWTQFPQRTFPVFIAPHGTTNLTIYFTTQPKDAWKLTVSIAEKLNGIPEFFVKLKLYARWWRQSSAITLPSPFTKGTSVYGKPRKTQIENLQLHPPRASAKLRRTSLLQSLPNISMDETKCRALKAELATLSEPQIVTAERFFDGNDDPGSIGCNLMKHPGGAAFRDAFAALLRRPDVQAVYAQISELDPGEGCWPFTDTVLVVGTISADELRKALEQLQPDEIGGAERFNISPAIGEKHRSPVLAVWWD